MKKSLLETNPYLRDSAERSKALTRNIASSSAIEGIRVRRDAKSGLFVSQANDKNSQSPMKSAKSPR